MDDEPDHYATLQVAPSAEAAVVAAAYRALARRYHPDVAGGDGEAMMRRLDAAWEVLGDPERRAAYDRQRAERARNGAPASPGAGSDGVVETDPVRPGPGGAGGGCTRQPAAVRPRRAAARSTPRQHPRLRPLPRLVARRDCPGRSRLPRVARRQARGSTLPP